MKKCPAFGILKMERLGIVRCAVSVKKMHPRCGSVSELFTVFHNADFLYCMLRIFDYSKGNL